MNNMRSMIIGRKAITIDRIPTTIAMLMTIGRMLRTIVAKSMPIGRRSMIIDSKSMFIGRNSINCV